MSIEKYDFSYNVSLKTINCINTVSFTYHISNHDYPINHIHTDYTEFTIITEGVIENITGTIKQIVEGNTLFITPSNNSHYFIKRSSALSFINIIVRDKALDEINKTFNLSLDSIIVPNKTYRLSDELLYTIKSNIDYVNSLTEEEWEKTNDVLKSTVISIFNYLYLENLKSDHTDGKWDNTLNRLKQDPEFYRYNVNELCSKLGYSRTQLNRIFMDKYQMTPSEYLRDLKMKYALSLLSHTDYSISEISKLVGYTNQNQFNKNFKEIFNKMPSEYKR